MISISKPLKTILTATLEASSKTNFQDLKTNIITILITEPKQWVDLVPTSLTETTINLKHNKLQRITKWEEISNTTRILNYNKMQKLFNNQIRCDLETHPWEMCLQAIKIHQTKKEWTLRSSQLRKTWNLIFRITRIKHTVRACSNHRL